MIEQLIPLLSPLRIAVLKHSHHLHIGPEAPHKDSVRYRAAGALSSLCVSAAVSFKNALHQLLSTAQVDIVIVESFRRAPIPKLLYAPNGVDSDWQIPQGIITQVGNSIEGLRSLENSPDVIVNWILSLPKTEIYTGKPG